MARKYRKLKPQNIFFHCKIAAQIGLILVAFIFTTKLVFAQTYSCYDCPCDQGRGTYWELSDCLPVCQVGLGCFTGICAAIEMPGRRPSVFEAVSQLAFGDLMECYSVTGDRDPKYNCIAWVSGSEGVWVWDEVDAVYGDMDGVDEVEDFDSYFSYGGYTTSSDCQQVGGYDKIVLYGEMQADGTWKPTHAARQAEFQEGGTDWWESKEGYFKRIVHHINDVSNEYGDVIKCYERYLGP